MTMNGGERERERRLPPLLMALVEITTR